ncbi:MAG: type II toxin-antitoxin system RelE/ParE family toxin [Nitrococcus mobilis]|nr:type II toxin-antitoxin system RelE/ParE family toxin [Nitrococcus mobilis]
MPEQAGSDIAPTRRARQPTNTSPLSPCNRLHECDGGRKGQHSMSVNDQWRICFRFIDGDAYDVELTDYH